MILAREFSRSAIARDADFSTNDTERGTFELMDRIPNGSVSSLAQEYSDAPEPRFDPALHSRARRRLVRGSLIAQFAANDAMHLADAAELISPYVDAIDLNCGEHAHLI